MSIREQGRFPQRKGKEQDEGNVLLEIADYYREYPKIEDAEMSHEDITKDEKVEDQHSNVLLTSFEIELRLQEKWIEDPKVYTKVLECKEEFQIKRKLKGISLEEKNEWIGKKGSRLQENLLKREENGEMVGGIEQGKEDS